MNTGSPTVGEVVEALDHRLESEVGGNEISLQRKYGLDALLPRYIEALPRIKHWPGRMHILYWIQRYARKDFRVVQAGLFCLDDRSAKVRHHACGILAYSLRRDLVHHLHPLLTHRNSRTRADAVAAIEAIKGQNHHLFVDRRGAGNVFWVLNPSDSPGAAGKSV